LSDSLVQLEHGAIILGAGTLVAQSLGVEQLVGSAPLWGKTGQSACATLAQPVTKIFWKDFEPL